MGVVIVVLEGFLRDWVFKYQKSRLPFSPCLDFSVYSFKCFSVSMTAISVS